MKGDNMPPAGNENEMNGPMLHFYAEMAAAFFEEARRRGYYTGLDVIVPELTKAGGDFTNAVLLNERMRSRYKGHHAAYCHDMAELHFYAGAYYTHRWGQDHASIKDRNFAMKFLRGGSRALAEPVLPLGREETEAFCSALYDIFAQRTEPYVKHPDLHACIHYGLNAFFLVSVSISARGMGLEGEQLPEDKGLLQVLPGIRAHTLALDEKAAGMDQTPQAAGGQPVPEDAQRWLQPVERASPDYDTWGIAFEEGSPERFWQDILGCFFEDARQRGYINEKVPFMYFLVQPGVDFVYTLMASRPFYESNRHDMPQYCFKIAWHAFQAGAYDAYLWDKQSTAYQADDFHLRLLRAGISATVGPLMPLSLQEASAYCLKLYLKYMDFARPYAGSPGYPLYVANGMHAFYMLGTAVQMKGMAF